MGYRLRQLWAAHCAAYRLHYAPYAFYYAIVDYAARRIHVSIGFFADEHQGNYRYNRCQNIDDPQRRGWIAGVVADRQTLYSSTGLKLFHCFCKKLSAGALVRKYVSGSRGPVFETRLRQLVFSLGKETNRHC